jgi:hypothetical protein
MTYMLALSSEEDEMVLADGGYNDQYEFFETPTGDTNDDQHMKAIARARHETINSRFKDWKILDERFICPLEKHGHVFMAIANITQLEIELVGHAFHSDEEAAMLMWSTLTTMPLLLRRPLLMRRKKKKKSSF